MMNLFLQNVVKCFLRKNAFSGLQGGPVKKKHPVESFAKGFRFLGLHLLFPPEHGLSPTGRVQHLLQPSHLRPCGGLKDDGCGGECH